MRTAFYRHTDSHYADWVVLDRPEPGYVHIYSNTLNTDITIHESNLIAAGRDMTSPMFLGPSEPEASHGTGSSAAGRVHLPAATSLPAAMMPAVRKVARPSSSPGMGGQPLARARHSDPASAHEAARRARRDLTDSQRRVLIIHAAAGSDGLSGDEMAEKMGGEANYALLGPRRPQLERSGFLEKAGLRPNRRNNPVQVYRCTAAGFALASRWMEADRARAV